MDTSVNSICALEWVSKPSLYRDFGSEDGLTADEVHTVTLWYTDTSDNCRHRRERASHLHPLFGEGAASGEWKLGIARELAARYLHEQIGLAVAGSLTIGVHLCP